MATNSYHAWVSSLLEEIEAYLPVEGAKECRPLSLTEASVERLAVGILAERSVIIRAILEALGFSETLPLRWRLEHKVMQYHILTRFLGSSIPRAVGLGVLAQEHSGAALHQYTSELFPQGYVLKPALGNSSTRATVLGSDSRDGLLRAAMQCPRAGVSFPLEETYIVQQRIYSIAEYRVHSIGRFVIPGLTFRTLGPLPPFSLFERTQVVRQVEEWLERLPYGIASEALLGWDVGRDKDNTFHVFEVNFSGVHNFYEPGFQCSGNFSSPYVGEIATAKLLQYLQQTVGLEVRDDIRESQLLTEGLLRRTKEMMHRVSRWTELFAVGEELNRLFEDSYFTKAFQTATFRELIYLDDRLTSSDISYLQYLDSLVRITSDLR